MKMHAPLRGAAPRRGGSKSSLDTLLVLERNSISRISQFSSPEVDLVLEREGRSRPPPALDSQAVSGCRTTADATRLRTPTGLIFRDGARVLGPVVPQLRDRDSLMSDLRHEISNLLCANSRRGGAMLKMLVFCDFEIAHYGLIPKSRLLGTPFRRTISTLQAPF